MKKIFEKFKSPEKDFLSMIKIGEKCDTKGPSSGVKILSIEKNEEGKIIIKGEYLDKEGQPTGNIDTWDETGKNIEGSQNSGADLDPLGERAFW